MDAPAPSIWTALDQALQVFWEKGYEGASVADLTAAMGINPPSLYAAFGNKEASIPKALDRYEAKRARSSRKRPWRPHGI